MQVMDKLDKRDAEILAERAAKYDDIEGGPRVGDFVRFADGVERRISYIWEGLDNYQTSDGGSYYIGPSGHVSMSGSLHSGVPGSTFRMTGETKEGSVWFFHHDQAQAHNGVDTTIVFHIYECPLDSKGNAVDTCDYCGKEQGAFGYCVKEGDSHSRYETEFVSPEVFA